MDAYPVINSEDAVSQVLYVAPHQLNGLTGLVPVTSLNTNKHTLRLNKTLIS